MNKIISDLQLLIDLASKKNSSQGVLTFQNYIDKLGNASEEEKKEIHEKLKYELAGFQRFADLNDDEWKVMNRLLQ